MIEVFFQTFIRLNVWTSLKKCTVISLIYGENEAKQFLSNFITVELCLTDW